ncbi:MAG TPA: GGDEF domain-containing protein, partial [Pseudomonas sp.]|nr:GGDEF domain-containing protein [Pseudomonas sp.]
VGVELLHRKIGKLREDAQTDPLTGLCNRRGLELTLDLWKLENRPFAVLALDIDHFKQVNDRFGHAAGDQVLQRLARLMRICSRDNDLLCRVGGEEFLMLLADASPASAERVAERLRRQVEMATIEPVGHITVSLGVAHWPTHAGDMLSALRVADDMLYAAKQAGRNCVVVAGSAANGVPS